MLLAAAGGVAGGALWWRSRARPAPVAAVAEVSTSRPAPSLPAKPPRAAKPAPTSAPAAPSKPALASASGTGADAGESFPRPVTNWLEAQVELARRNFSSGPIDGVPGAQTKAALQAFQENEGLETTGWLDDATRERLQLSLAALSQYTVTAQDLVRLQPLSPTWTGKAQQTALDYETILELVAERAHANPKLIVQLNPGVDWQKVQPGTKLTLPFVERAASTIKAANLHVRLAEHVLQVRDEAGRIIAHFPVSIARDVEKRPVGELHVTVVIPNPDYTFDPAVFPEAPEKSKLVVPPGPNNPVGVAWIGLDRTGYGIHGTPDPEHVGRTESHGCFRLANWDALTLLDLAWVGLPVFVDP
jgi:lipoprotein-anchoring transpeptidase ErfK/SrfK